jgi:hypothetical protein
MLSSDVAETGVAQESQEFTQAPAAPADEAHETPEALAADAIAQDSLLTQQDPVPPLQDTAAPPAAPITSSSTMPHDTVHAAQDQERDATQETVCGDAAACGDATVYMS